MMSEANQQLIKRLPEEKRADYMIMVQGGVVKADEIITLDVGSKRYKEAVEEGWRHADCYAAYEG